MNKKKFQIGDRIRLGNTIETEIIGVKENSFLTRGKKGKILRVFEDPFGGDSIYCISHRGKVRLRTFDRIELINPFELKRKKR